MTKIKEKNNIDEKIEKETVKVKIEMRKQMEERIHCSIANCQRINETRGEYEV